MSDEHHSDVAQRAGVSTMTVSRVINSSGYSSPEARARVEAAIDELGYVPNALARQLRSKRTKTLALVVSDISNPFFTTIARGAEDVAVRHGFSVMYCNTDESEREEAQYLLMLVERQVDGVPVKPGGRRLPLLNPTACRWSCWTAGRAPRRQRAATRAGAMLTRHLIGWATAGSRCSRARRTLLRRPCRRRRRALEEAGPRRRACATVASFSSLHQADGHRMARSARLDSGRPTAIFAVNNFIAFGAIRALHEAGIRVPEDMSVVAFDDLPAEWVSDPFLTVAAQPAYEIGRHAAAMLLDEIAGERVAAGEDLVLPFRARHPALHRPATPRTRGALAAGAAG
jgi:LacI family transcriptional regulator